MVQANNMTWLDFYADILSYTRIRTGVGLHARARLRIMSAGSSHLGHHACIPLNAAKLIRIYNHDHDCD